MSLHIVFSNRMEVLARRLLEALGRVPANPFEAQQVVVPTTAVSRYLQLAVAESAGVCANVQFGYLASWLWQLARAVDPAVPQRSPVDPSSMTWLVMRLLKEGGLALSPRIGGFVKEADDLMLYDLSRSTAQVFDQYATYRPDWLTLWMEGRSIPDFHGSPKEDEAWQSELWRAVAVALGIGNAHPLQTIFEKVARHRRTGAVAGLPESASVFAVPAIPPLYLQTICRLSGVMDITLYIMNPCREYWFDIVSPKRLAWLQSQKLEAYREIGHPLLAVWGQSVQSAIDLIYEEGIGAETSDSTEFIEPDANTLLGHLQKSILNMEDPPRGSAVISPADRSIEIHCCHAAVRELEVLHDRLLDLFDADPTLKTDDVVVLTPDIDALAPAVDAVFGAAPPRRRIPYSIAGRAMAQASVCLRVVIDLLDLISSRMPASRVFDFLRQAPVARRYELEESGLSRIRDWLHTAGMRWGIDAAHRAALGVVPEDRHTFRNGLDALFLGLALPHPDQPLAGLMPAESLEGSRAETLGQLWLFMERLAFWKDRLQEAKPANRWQDLLHGMMSDFIAAEGEWQNDYDKVAGAIAELAGHWKAAGLCDPVSARVVRTALLDADAGRRGAVPSGMVTFASLAAMRGLPYRVVCLIGMNDNDFPGREHSVEFDLMAGGKPRRGDRQRRSEDRGIFLDAILSARETLHISYTGRDQRSNALMPPSVVVAELLDYLVLVTAADEACPADVQAARDRLTVNHPLQPFSRRYFDGSEPRLSSYVRQYADALSPSACPVESETAAMRVVSEKEDEEEEDRSAPPFFDTMPAPPEMPQKEASIIALEDLSSFLHNPSRFFLERRLKITLAETRDGIADEEPLILDFQDARNLAEVIVETCLAQNRLLGREASSAILGSLPSWPTGAAGEAALQKIWPLVSGLAERVLAAAAEQKLPPWHTSVSLPISGHNVHLAAGFSDLRSCGLVRYRCDELRGYDHLRAWLDHLVLCASPPQGVALRTRHLAFDGDLVFEALTPDIAGRYLADLLLLYAEGLQCPVPFFRKAAWEYVQGGMKKARTKWFGAPNAKGRPESGDIWHALAWRGVEDPLDDQFMQTAETVFRPMISHLAGEKPGSPEE